MKKKTLCRGGIAMNKWLRRMRVKAILPAAALIAAAAIGTTFAWQSWDLSVTNKLKAHDTEVNIEEEFDPSDPWDHKKVRFENTGSSSVFLRVSYTEHWETADGKILSNQFGTSGSETDAAEKHFSVDWSQNWQTFGDGWYYYKKILPAGVKTADILEQVTFAVPETDPAYETYRAADYYLYFKAEAVQCSDGSNTLNSDKVNADATEQLFGRKASVQKDPQTGEITGVSWQ